MEVRIRNIDDWIVEYHRQQAKAKKTTLEKELKRVLADAAMSKRRALVRKLKKNSEALRKKYGTFPDSTALIREIRDEWG